MQSIQSSDADPDADLSRETWRGLKETAMRQQNRLRCQEMKTDEQLDMCICVSRVMEGK